MDDSANHPRAAFRVAASWTLILAVAFGLRVVAAFLVTRYAEGQGKPCVFADTLIYRELARSIAVGEPYVVMQFGSPHYALRTPGYPLFLAACRVVFGESLLAVRVVQAVLGTLGVWLVAKLVGSVVGSALRPQKMGQAPGEYTRSQFLFSKPFSVNPLLSIPLMAAALAAVHPYLVAMSALVLSEATFLPLMMLGLWGLACLWGNPEARRSGLIAIGTGLAMGAAILCRPSWALFVPVVLASWVIGSRSGSRVKALKGSVIVALATAAILAPWWIRNGRVIGRFVPTALWVGASLYDGIGPQANGSSEMVFVEAPDVRSLGEVEQDAVFRGRSLGFAREHPRRVLELAAIKLARFWSPWPNADTIRSPWISAGSAVVTLPLFGLIALGVFDRRRDFRTLALLAGPLVYFCVLHMVFVSSIRYRIPGELPAMGLASLGLGRILKGLRPMSIRRRVKKMLGWALVLALSVAVGGVIAAYFYVTDSDNLSDLIRREAPKYLPHARVNVSKVRVGWFKGEVTVSNLDVRELVGGSPGQIIGKSKWIQVRFDPWAMMKGRFEPRDVTVAKPTIRLARMPDGTWNLQGLLADPFPVSTTGVTPPITIQEGTIELLEEGAQAALTLLRDVSIKIPATTSSTSPVNFELTAKGEAGLFDRVHVEGTVDPTTGRVTLRAGELVRLTLSKALRDRLPASIARALGQAGLEGGEIDADLPSLTYDPSTSPKLHYQATANLRQGFWNCPKLPFPISDVSIRASMKDGELTITQALGSDGPTSLSLTGKATLNLEEPAKSPFEIHARATNLELDARIRHWIPDDTKELWDGYFPQVNATPPTSAGRVSVTMDAGRPNPDAEVDYKIDVDCIDVSMKYKHFAYPVDHVGGKIQFTPGMMTLDVRTWIGNQPLVVTGNVVNPGRDAETRLEFNVASLPVDDVLRRALPKEVRTTVDRFKPTGSVRGKANLVRLPPLKKGDDPRGRVTFDAWIDLNPGCSIIWEGLTYPVLNLTGKLEIHPDHWIFKEMKGNNGQARIWADGDVKQLARDIFKVDVRLQARNLPFDDQLRNALPKPWQVTWATLNPTGASDIDAQIEVKPDKTQHDRIVIVPHTGTGVKLRFSPLVGTDGVASTPIELRMDDVSGTFVYDTADVPHTSMTDVKFWFHNAPVKFARGTVDVKDNGQFQLEMKRLEVTGLRLDDEVRRYMPPVMASNARRLNDDKIPLVKADLSLGWSGKPGESAWCQWKDALVVLANNRVSVGTDLNLEHIEGQLDSVQGSFNGRELDVHGRLAIDTVSIFNQQITGIAANLDVEKGLAQLGKIKAKVLGGTLSGHVSTTLDAMPQYSIRLDLQKAQLRDYAMNQPGHQSVQGQVTARVDLSGLGYDPHNITGTGMAEIVQGDLGTLPVALRFFNVLKTAKESRKDTKTAFDSAELAFSIVNGDAKLDPVHLVGNAFSLDGNGKIDFRGDIDVKLKILAGRDGLHIPLFSVFARELGGQIAIVHVHGPAASPVFNLEFIPATGEFGKALKQNQQNREIKKSGLTGPMQNGPEPKFKQALGNRLFGPNSDDKVD
jgi:4-amino-4-deoxy-L-arabinose transferase-like glycosyltransferase